ncbi:hypothetical protein LX64_03063 [Chitinophaga skermanii]|uniref:Outer membrane protein with beta-barrel domain n=1 Tax=Chitinophaga skermanii TaxID=331697 RepID=A0A327QJL3_9BACT|nr:hypothetical protein [Chitinophaga skermanii]RAJ04185.1 hypothetical protein LX64_03063 [Chitinophaga skermanii]
MRYVKVGLLAIATIFASRATAQQFEQGVIIRAVGDSVKGFLETRTKDRTPQSIRFKTTATGTIETYTPDQIQGFKYNNGNVYTSQQLSLDLTTHNITALEKMGENERNIQQKKFFIEQVLKGKMSLYKMVYDNSLEYYILEDENGQFTPLNNTVMYNHKQDAIQTLPYYQTTLLEKMGNCVDVNKINTIQYKETALINVVKKYQACKYGTATVQDIQDTRVKSGPLQFGVLAGYGSASFKYDLFDGKADSKNSGTPLVGAFMNIPLSRQYMKMSIVVEGLYRQVSTEGTKTDMYSEVRDFKAGFSYAQLNALFRYMFPSKSSIKPLLFAGFGNSFVISTKENEYKRRVALNDNRDAGTMFTGVRNYEQSFIVGAGIMVKKFGVDVRYEGGNGFSSLNGTQVGRKQVSGVVKYNF